VKERGAALSCWDYCEGVGTREIIGIAKGDETTCEANAIFKRSIGSLWIHVVPPYSQNIWDVAVCQAESPL
jgi:hypothetical protein